jgi:hypothetical protein
MNKKSGIRTGIVVLVLLLAVGFAAVTTQLVINGTINIGANTSDFVDNVVFHSATASGPADPSVTGDTAATVTGQGTRTLVFTTQILDYIGESATLEFDIENGSQYTAQLGTLKCAEGTYTADNFPTATAAKSFTSADGYVTVTADDGLDQDTIAKKSNSTATVSTDKGHVTVTMIRSFTGVEADPTANPPVEASNSKTLTFTCMIDASAVDA